jgi:DNA processing protein
MMLFETYDERAFATALAMTIGTKTLDRLLSEFGSLYGIYSAPDLRRVPGVGKVIAGNIRRIDLSQTLLFLRSLEDAGIRTLLWKDALYPPPLTTLPDKPLILFVRGTLPTDWNRCVAIVGTRQASAESLTIAEELGSQFAAHGWTVISGMALGIDGAAHRGALMSSGHTVAVLGSGVNRIYPSEHADLANRILVNGALISEIRPDVDPTPNGLVSRNRIITGLSRAVMVVEAGASSGALHAARAAMAQNRPVFVFPNSAGNMQLLENGAHTFDSVQQIITRCEVGL